MPFFRTGSIKLAIALFLTTSIAIADETSDHPSGEPSVQVLTRSQTSWDGSQLPAYPEGQPEITVLRITIPAGARLPEHLHPVINAGVLLRGQLRVVAGDKHLDLEAGDALVELVDQWHYGNNPGDTDAEIIVFYAGTVDKAITLGREPDPD